MEATLLLLRLAGCISLLIVIYIVWRRESKLLTRFVYIGMAISLCAYLIVGAAFITIDADLRLPLGKIVNGMLIMLSMCLPWLTMMLCQFLCTGRQTIFFVTAFLVALQLGLDLMSANSINWNCQTVNCLTFPKDRFSLSELVHRAVPMLLKGLFLALALLLVFFNLINKNNRRQWGLNLYLLVIIALVGSIFILEDSVLLVFGARAAYFLQKANILLVFIFSSLTLFLLLKYWQSQALLNLQKI